VKVLVLLAMIAAATAGHDKVYRWTDGQGAVRASNSLAAIPEMYRSSAVEMRVENIYQTPQRQQRGATARGRATIEFEPSDGQMRAMARFDGKASRMAIIDTGSDLVAITTKLARALGHDIAKCPKTWIATGAGRTQVPVVTLRSVKVGGAEALGVQAVVMDFQGRGSVSAIVGMSYLSLFVFEIDSGAGIMTLSAQGEQAPFGGIAP